MADATQRKPPAAAIRTIVLVVAAGTIAFFVWRNATRQEGYQGGNVTTTGTVEAGHVDLGFKIGGRVAEMPVAEGTVVTPGQVVGRLETQDLDVQVATTRAALEAARAALAQARAHRDQATRDLGRQRELMASDATTPQQLDAAQAAARTAAAQVDAAEAQVRQAGTVLEQAQLQRSYAELRAPMAGQVFEKMHEAGEMVAAGAPVLMLADVDTVEVHAPVDETRIGAVRTGDAVRLRVYTFDRRFFTGQVTRIEPVGEFATRKDWGAQRRDIRTFTVTARVPNPQHLLKDGMTAEVTIQVTPQGIEPNSGANAGALR